MTDKNNEPKTFNSFPLFNEIEDTELRKRNQAVILANIFEDGFDKGKVQVKASLLIFGYFREIAPEDRADVKDKFIEFLKERGFNLNA